MDDLGDRKVLRSFYLPEPLDERLRVAAFRVRDSKGELVRRFVQVGLDSMERARAHAAGSPPATEAATYPPKTNTAAEEALSDLLGPAIDRWDRPPTSADHDAFGAVDEEPENAPGTNAVASRQGGVL